MAVVISGTNNSDKITATDGLIDLLSSVNFASEVSVPSFKVGSDIQIGNAGIITATTLVGNLQGNINHTSNLLLQISGSEKFRVGTSGQLGIGGANYGTSGQVLTSGGSSSAASWTTITQGVTSDGSQNTVGGTNAGDSIVSGGTENTVFGYNAGTAISTGDNNTFFGSRAGRSMSTGLQNTGVGYNVMGNTSGTGNAALGQSAGNGILGGSYNVALGWSALSNTNNNGTNNIVIGKLADISASNVSNEITLGNSDISHFRIPGIGVSFGRSGATIAGVVTATSFSGSGANLTNINSTSATGDFSIVDKIIHTGNTNTAIRFPADNEISMEVNGTERFRMNSIGYATFSGSLTQFQGASFAQDLSIADTIKHTGDTNTRIRFPANDTISFQTDGTERLRINSSGNVLIGDGATYTPGCHVHLHGGTSGLQQLRVQNHTSIGSFSGNYGSEFRHAYSSANHCMLIHTQEAATSRRTLDISDSNGVFASFTNHRMGLGTGITSPNATLDIRTTNDDDAIRLVNTSTGNNGIQWWNEYGGLTKRVSMDYGEGDANFDIKLFRADAQDDRPYGNVRIFTGDYSNPNMNFRVTTLGTVHQPNQPAFLVRDSVSGGAFGANSYADFDTIILNRGNHYNTSNGRFTAPIAGTYLFLSLMLSEGSNRLFHEIRKNGSRIEGTRTESGTNAGQYQSCTTQAIIDLAKGDWVAIHVGSGGAYGSAFSNFSGYLLG